MEIHLQQKLGSAECIQALLCKHRVPSDSDLAASAETQKSWVSTLSKRRVLEKDDRFEHQAGLAPSRSLGTWLKPGWSLAAPQDPG